MFFFDYNQIMIFFPFSPSFASLPHFKLLFALVTVRVTSSLLHSVVKLLPTICHSRKWNKRTKCSQKLICFVLHSPIKGTKHFQNVFCLLQTPSKGLALSKCVCLFQPT